jgi:hypothetical protein
LSEGAIKFEPSRIAWCRACSKQAPVFSQLTTDRGVIWSVRCHQTHWQRLATWSDLRNRMRGWSFEAQFEDTPITFKKAKKRGAA